ncbi:Ig-like domain-containing protein [Planosporangium sp. 12N6]|uniref:L,D-transpeptidase n=1 Tax=Planosporangium spinosum TaxID=3402278 RepID=UPI003CEA37B0
MGQSAIRGQRWIATVVALVALLTVGACGSDRASPGAKGTPRPGGSSPSTPPAPTAAVSFPADGATDVPTSAEIAFTTQNAQSAAVTLTDAAGAAVEGALRADGSSWVPGTQLKYSTRYTAAVSAVGADGKQATKTVAFTTMDRPGSFVSVRSQLGDDMIYGVGMPVVINFDSDVPADQRANVEKRLFVSSEPAQEGAWNWFNAHEVHYRPREYWKAGTKLSIRLATGGLPFGGGAYGAADITVRASIGDKFVMTIDNATKMMSVTRNDQEVKTMPVSLGKPSAPSSSGNMIVMVKNEWEWFDSSTYGVPVGSADGYRTKVFWPQRLTWGGQYIHAAPWSVADQGQRNVSHGCTNVSTENADWLWHQTHIGDPVIVKGTERGLDWGDGWTDWNVSWEEYLKGSALPRPMSPGGPDAAASGSTSAQPSAQPSAS